MSGRRVFTKGTEADFHMKCSTNDLEAVDRIAARLQCDSSSDAMRRLIQWLDDSDDETIDMVRHHIGT